MAKSLPLRPNIELLRKQAKELKKAFVAQKPQALERVGAHHPRHAELGAALPLQEAQLVIAREYGHSSWPKFMAAIEQGDAFTNPIQQAIDANDLDALTAFLQDDPAWLEQVCETTDRRGRIQRHTPLGYAYQRRNAMAMRILLEAGADMRVLEEALFGCCENHNLEGLDFLLPFGVDPNRAYNDGWDCTVLYGLLQTYTRSQPEHLHACVNRLIEAGARFEDGPVMDIHRGDLARLEERLQENAGLVHERFVLEYGDHLTLRGVTLLHVAAEYGEVKCIDLLLRYGADLNAPAEIGANGVGGQTPLFHVIGSNQGRCFAAFEHLMTKKPDLTVKAQIQAAAADDGKVMDCIHKGADHFFDQVVERTPLGYAHMYQHEPHWREASREAARLREMGAPE